MSLKSTRHRPQQQTQELPSSASLFGCATFLFSCGGEGSSPPAFTINQKERIQPNSGFRIRKVPTLGLVYTRILNTPPMGYKNERAIKVQSGGILPDKKYPEWTQVRQYVDM
mmetsp:Transcript_14343/g.21550  ORF Transcript_14343/g.21550 Transcript_14343/m.21550 type:complete len:112 (-) Transcript_14343:975-1310(-)